MPPACRSATTRYSSPPSAAQLSRNAASSYRLSLLPRAFSHSLPAVRLSSRDSGSHRADEDRRSAALLSVLVLFSALKPREPFMTGLPSPAEARSWRFYAFSEPLASQQTASTLSADRACFVPATLLSFCLQGLAPLEDRDSVSEALPPVPFSTTPRQCLRLRRVDPSEEGGRRPKPAPAVPSWHSPLWGFLSRRGEPGFPASPLTRFGYQDAIAP